jgi:hypothetical protein
MIYIKGCKQKMACQNNQVQNERAAWVPTQCNPIFHANSVCRCCCSDKDGCNEKDDFCFETPRCPPLEPKRDLIQSCSNNRELDSVCNFECKLGGPNAGYEVELVGSPVSTCNLDTMGAMWTPKQPYCKRIYKCPIETVEAPLSEKCSDKNNANSRCDFSCPQNFRLIGSRTRTCRQAGERAIWDNSQPKCEAVCDILPDMKHGRASCTNFNFLQSKCTYECDGGYKLKGALSKTCTALKDFGGADWQNESAGAEPRCEPVCNDLGELENGKLVCTGNEVGDVCNHVCNDGFNLLGTKERTCISDINGWNGVNWDGERAYCQPICPEVKKVPNTVVSCSSSTDLGSECTFVCISGYEMVGKPKTTCMLNINDGTADWDNQEPECQLLCNNPMEIDNGKVECSMESNSIGNECQYTCNDGYRLIGSDSSTCELNENQSAVWTSNAPYCERT